MIKRAALLLALLIVAPCTFAALTDRSAEAVAIPPPEANEIDRILVVVNDDVITRSDLSEEMHTVALQLRQRNQPVPPEDILQKQVLERLILKDLQLQMADTTGIRVDDETLNRGIEGIAKQNNLSADQFREVLTRDGYDFATFREDIRKEIIINRLQQRQVSNKINVSDQEVDNFLATRKAQGTEASQEYHVADILVALPEAASPEQIQAARARAQQVLDTLRNGANFRDTATASSENQQALQGGDLGWLSAGQLPPALSAAVTGIEVNGISDVVRGPGGFHIIKLLEKRGGGGPQIVRQSQVRHILLRPNELLSDSDAQIRLEQLKQRVEGGEDFAALARANSSDTATASNGGSLGWVSPGDLVSRFEEAVNEVQTGQVSAPFQTEFGWHIAQVMERRDFDNSTESARSQAREAIRRRKNDEETQAWLRSLRDEAFVEYKT